MATLTIPVDRISERARRRVDVHAVSVRVARLLATFVLGVFYLIGWSVHKLWLGLVWIAGRVRLGLTMLWVAAVEGWRDAGRSTSAKGGRSR